MRNLHLPRQDGEAVLQPICVVAAGSHRYDIFVAESKSRNELSVGHLTCLDLWMLMHIENFEVELLASVQIPRP